MDLAYLIGSLAGIAILVGLNIVLFGHAPARVDVGDAARRLALEVPGFRLGESAQARDGSAALIENGTDGSLYLARIGGDALVIRKFARGALRQIRREGASLTLALRDFTFPKAKLPLADEGSAADWEARIRRVAG